MIKQVWMAECDFCGKMERARITGGQYNEDVHILPVGWKYGVNDDFCVCDDCYKRLRRDDDGENE